MDDSQIIRMDLNSKTMNLLSYAIRYKYSTWKELKRMVYLVSKGHEIKWSSNERWCVINGESFNISKTVYEKRVLESELEDVFTEYCWNEGRPVHIACDYDGKGGEVIFDFSVQEVDLKKLDDYLTSIFEKNNK